MYINKIIKISRQSIHTSSVLFSSTVFCAPVHELNAPISGKQLINSVSFIAMMSSLLTVVKASETSCMLAQVQETERKEIKQKNR